MKSSIRDKLEQLSRRREELDAILGDELTTRDMDNYRKLTREHAEIGPVVALYGAYQAAEADIAAAREMLADPEMKEMAEEEIVAGEAEIVRLDEDLQKALLPKDPNDERNIFLEIERAQVARSRRCSPAISIACIRAMPSARAGKSSRSRPVNPTLAATRK